MDIIPTITVLLILTILLLLYKKTIEGYNMGTIIQLTAKDPQDTYLTGDASKYFTYPYGPYPYNYPYANTLMIIIRGMDQ